MKRETAIKTLKSTLKGLVETYTEEINKAFYKF